EDVGAARRGAQEKVGGRVAGAFVVAQSILVAVAAELVDGLEAGGALVFEVHVFEGAVGAQHEAHHQGVAHAQRGGGG
nr:hypothetical protein [Tanacetum cinerariifolium]